MATNTTIEWTEKTWNPIAGCTPVSPGCLNCYAANLAHRLEAMGQVKYVGTTTRVNGRAVFNGTIKTDFAALGVPAKVTKPTRWFVNSMSDLFHENVPPGFRKQVFEMMNACDWHQFQVLTKRPEIALEVANDLTWTPNIWMGTSVEDANYAHRSATLAKIPAKVRFLSVEPLLGAIPSLPLDGIDWVIIGCESGPKRRPFDDAWAADVVAQCRARNVKVFVKQIVVNGKVSKNPSKWDKKLRVRQYPRRRPKVPRTKRRTSATTSAA